MSYIQVIFIIIISKISHAGGRDAPVFYAWKKKKLQNFQSKSAVHPGKYTNMGTWNHAGFARFSVTGDKAILNKTSESKKKKSAPLNWI